MTGPRSRFCAAIVLVGMALGGCVGAQFPTPASDDTRVEFVAAHKTAAKKLMRQGRLADALVAWRVLSAVDRNDPEVVRGLKSARSAVKREAKKRSMAGDAALAKGRFKKARILYLSVLAVDPWNRNALRHLREIETRRLRKANGTKVEKPVADGQAPLPEDESKAKSSDPKPSQAMETESSTLQRGMELFKKGTYLESIREFEKHLGTHPGDARALRRIADAYLEMGYRRDSEGKLLDALEHYESASRYGPKDSAKITQAIRATRKRLADEYYENGVRSYRTDVAAAIRSWEEGLRYDPDHVKTKLQLKNAYKLQENLAKINGSSPAQ